MSIHHVRTSPPAVTTRHRIFRRSTVAFVFWDTTASVRYVLWASILPRVPGGSVWSWTSPSASTTELSWARCISRARILRAYCQRQARCRSSCLDRPRKKYCSTTGYFGLMGVLRHFWAHHQHYETRARASCFSLTTSARTVQHSPPPHPYAHCNMGSWGVYWGRIPAKKNTEYTSTFECAAM